MNTVERLTDLEEQGRDHTARLIGIEKAFGALHDDVRTLSREVKTLIGTVTRHDARPQVELHKVLTIVATGIVIFGSVVSGIIYVSGNVNAPRALENKLKVEFMKQRLDNGWHGEVSTWRKKQDSNAVTR